MISNEIARKFYLALEELAGAPLGAWCSALGCVRKEVPGYMRLTIEAINTSIVSLAHWGEQNGDAMRDPEVVFDVNFQNRTAVPVEYRNDYAGAHDMFFDFDTLKYDVAGVTSCAEFCELWFQNLRDQGFFDAPRAEVEA